MKAQARHSAIHKTPQNRRCTSSNSKNFGSPKKKDLHFLFCFSVLEKSILYSLNHDLPHLNSDGPRTSPTSEVGASTYMDIDPLPLITPCYGKSMAAEDFSFLSYYRPQGKVMFSQVSVILSIIGLMATRLLLIPFTAQSVRILLECFLVQ